MGSAVVCCGELSGLIYPEYGSSLTYSLPPSISRWLLRNAMGGATISLNTTASRRVPDPRIDLRRVGRGAIGGLAGSGPVCLTDGCFWTLATGTEMGKSLRSGLGCLRGVDFAVWIALPGLKSRAGPKLA